MKALLTEPLVIFIAAGLLLFAANGWIEGRTGDTITVTPAVTERLAAQWQGQMSRPPTDEELANLLGQWLEEELYYREAMRLGLDEDDVIIRRRLVQKLRFMTEDLALAKLPERADLQAFWLAHRADYADTPRYSFSHRFFSREARDDAEAAARQALADPDHTGDPFILSRQYGSRSAAQIASLFGREFAASITALAPDKPGTWQGPIASSYGWHTVKLVRVEPGGQPPFDEVELDVLRDYEATQRSTAMSTYLGELRSRWTVINDTADTTTP